MVREGQKRKNRGSSPKIDKSPQLAGLNNLNGSSPLYFLASKIVGNWQKIGGEFKCDILGERG